MIISQCTHKGVAIMKLSHALILAVLISSPAFAEPLNSVANKINKNNLNMGNIGSITLLNPIIQNAKASCSGPSSAVRGTLVNNLGTAQTYTPILKGQEYDNCVEYYPASGMCGNSPCLPTVCKKSVPGKNVSIKGSEVSVPAKGKKDFIIVVGDSLKTASVSAGNATANIKPPPESGSCIQ